MIVFAMHSLGIEVKGRYSTTRATTGKGVVWAPAYHLAKRYIWSFQSRENITYMECHRSGTSESAIHHAVFKPRPHCMKTQLNGFRATVIFFESILVYHQSFRMHERWSGVPPPMPITRLSTSTAATQT